MAIADRFAKHFEHHRTEILERHKNLAALQRARQGPECHMDVVFQGAMRRSFSLTRGFFDLVASENYISAAPLVRLQLDNAIRAVAAFHVDDPRAFIRHTTQGRRIDQLKGRDGQKLTDKHIVDHLSEELPWVRRVYREGCAFVHLSNVHLYGLSDREEVLPIREPLFSDFAFAELVESFVMATELFFNFAERWTTSILVSAGQASVEAVTEDGGTIQSRLQAFFASHRILTCCFEEWLLVEGKLIPAIKASIDTSTAHHENVQLDVEVLLHDGVIRESYVGVGVTEADAIDDALYNFAVGSFHVMLTAFWERPPGDQATVELWQICDSRWRATKGNFVVRTANPESVRIPDGFGAAIMKCLSSLTEGGDIQWVRVFYGNADESSEVLEVLLNNRPWPECHAAIRSLEWVRLPRYYSVRCFMLLQRIEAKEGSNAD